MKAFAAVGLVTALSLASVPAFAEPKKMSDAQMDNVTGGALVNVAVVAVDVVDITNNEVAVAIPVNASVAVGVLGTAVSGALQQPGRIRQ